MTKPRILVVEDEFLIALDIQRMLNEAGKEVLGPAGTLEDALRLARDEVIDAALLDVNLAGYPVDAVADALARRGIPFFFVTGHLDKGLPQAHQHVPVLTKPFTEDQLLHALRRIAPN